MSAGQEQREAVRFSPGSIALRRDEVQVYAASIQDKQEQLSEEGFAVLAEEMRAYLSAPRGETEEERRHYSELLNRAVLGYADERQQVLALVADRLLRLRIHAKLPTKQPYSNLAEALFAEVIGMNVLELIMREREGLEEIQVVGTQIYEVRQGEARPSGLSFESVRELERVQQNLVLYNNDRINPRKRWAEVVLRDGSRVTMTGFGFTAQPTLTIRFYITQGYRLVDLCKPAYRSMELPVLSLMQALLKARLNLIIIGATNTGKTHLMKALIAELPDEERLVVIEGRHEMMLGRDFPQKNVIEYEAEEEDVMHSAEQAFKLALRQSPKRIIHAEIRDSDANIYVRACTRGHAGSMTTVHANTLEDVPEAIADMCMLDGRQLDQGRLIKRITRHVAEVGIELRHVGKRRIVARVGELSWEDGQVVVTDLAVYCEKTDSWTYPATPSSRILPYLESLQHTEGSNL